MCKRSNSAVVAVTTGHYRRSFTERFKALALNGRGSQNVPTTKQPFVSIGSRGRDMKKFALADNPKEGRSNSVVVLSGVRVDADAYPDPGPGRTGDVDR